jgi:hypothetical protein
LARVGCQERGWADGGPRAWCQALLLTTRMLLAPATRVALLGQRGSLAVSGPMPARQVREGPCVLLLARGLAARGGVSLRRVGALGRLPLQLHEFRVDGAQTALTGHLRPPPDHARALEATGGMFQLGEPSMDGMRQRRTSLASPLVGCGLAVEKERAVSVAPQGLVNVWHIATRRLSLEDM